MRELILKAVELLKDAKDGESLESALQKGMSRADIDRLLNANLFTIFSTITVKDVLEMVESERMKRK